MFKKAEKGYLEINDNTIRFCDQIFQISNITQISKHTIKKKKLRKFCIALGFILAGIVGFFITEHPAPFLALSPLGLVLAVGLFFLKTEYALTFETSSGSTDAFTSRDPEFIDEIIDTLSEVIENPKEGTDIKIHVEKQEIVDNSSHKYVAGNEVQGDNFQNVSNSSIVNRSSDSTATTTISTIYGEHVDKALEEIANHIHELKDQGCATLLEKFKDALIEPEPDKSRIRSLWDCLLKLLPEVSKVAQSVATVAAAVL